LDEIMHRRLVVRHSAEHVVGDLALL
jgi:hypothetical protein